MSLTRRRPDGRVPAPRYLSLGWRIALTVGLLLLIVLGDLVVLLLVSDIAAKAAAPPPPAPPVAPDLNTVLNNVRNWIMGILALLATVFLSIGGARYLISNGDPAEIGKAKDSFRNAGYGYGLAALAPVVVQILKQIVGG